jgi:hypothetical protein
MDLDKLSREDRLSIWEEFQSSYGWQLLKRDLKKKKTTAPHITNRDSKEAFLYAAIRNQVIDELLLLPETLAGDIKNAMK